MTKKSIIFIIEIMCSILVCFAKKQSENYNLTMIMLGITLCIVFTIIYIQQLKKYKKQKEQEQKQNAIIELQYEQIKKDNQQ